MDKCFEFIRELEPIPEGKKVLGYLTRKDPSKGKWYYGDCVVICLDKDMPVDGWEFHIQKFHGVSNAT